jgi:hypothetical protein
MKDSCQVTRKPNTDDGMDAEKKGLSPKEME